MYSGLEIAKYIINKCIELNRPINNLQLQKVLYYVQGEYIKKSNGNILFNSDIVAWSYGPSVPDVYFEYNNYCASDIRDYQIAPQLEEDIKLIIDPIIEEKSKLMTWILVEQTHLEKPWIETFSEGNGSLISKSKLRKWFLKKTY